MTKKVKKILFTGGGTGGHAAPILAIEQKMKQINPEVETHVIGMGAPEEREFFSSMPNYHQIYSGKIHRHLTMRNLPELAKMTLGFFQAFYLLCKIKPDLVFSKGGFASVPVVLASRILGKPYFLHESDIEMGKVNHSMAEGAKKVFVSYPVNFYPHLDKKRTVFSGPILRQGYLEDRTADKALFGFTDNKPVIFLTGGSQGSLNVSKNFISIVKDLLSDFNIVHQAGKHSIQISEEFKKTLPEEARKGYYLASFLGTEKKKDYFLEAVNLSDLVITRAGSTIVELAVKAKPMIVVPWKHSAQDHQSKNAHFLSDQSAAIVITDDELGPDVLKKAILDLFANDKKGLKELSSKVVGTFPDNGAEVIVNEILREV